MLPLSSAMPTYCMTNHYFGLIRFLIPSVADITLTEETLSCLVNLCEGSVAADGLDCWTSQK
jgi:hypothetical protein